MAFPDLDLLQGTLNVLVLRALSWHPMHRYAVARFIREASGELVGVCDRGRGRDAREAGARVKPNFWRGVPGKWNFLLRIFARRPEDDVEAELRFHFDERTAELTAQGMAADGFMPPRRCAGSPRNAGMRRAPSARGTVRGIQTAAAADSVGGLRRSRRLRCTRFRRQE